MRRWILDPALLRREVAYRFAEAEIAGNKEHLAVLSIWAWLTRPALAPSSAAEDCSRSIPSSPAPAVASTSGANQAGGSGETPSGLCNGDGGQAVTSPSERAKKLFPELRKKPSTTEPPMAAPSASRAMEQLAERMVIELQKIRERTSADSFEIKLPRLAALCETDLPSLRTAIATLNRGGIVTVSEPWKTGWGHRVAFLKRGA